MDACQIFFSQWNILLFIHVSDTKPSFTLLDLHYVKVLACFSAHATPFLNPAVVF